MRAAAAFAVLAVFFAAPSWAQVDCPCDVGNAATMQLRQCALCQLAEQQPAGIAVFFVQDSSPRKPDRWLALPRMHSPGMHQMAAIPAEVRAELWRGAIAKAKELWGERWGVAYNAEQIHSQCHVHIHIGKLIDGVEWGEFKVVDAPEQIPLPGKFGLWVHPADGKLHVHVGELATENVLMR